MDKTKKTSSQSIIEGTMSNYDKALNYYGLQGKNSRQVAASLNYIPTIKIKVKGKPEKQQKLTDPNQTKYQDKVRDEVIRRWKDDTKKVVGTYSLRFKKYNKEKKKYINGEMKFNVVSEKADQAFLAQLAFEKRAQELQEEYDEWKDFNYVTDDIKPVGDKTGSGADNGKTITTTKGGQRKVGMKGHKAVIKMKDRFALKFADDEEQEWDRGEGTCVFDYIYEKYRCKELDGTKTNPKSREDAYKWLNDLLKIEIDTENPLRDGVSVYQLEYFCDHFKCNMYAYDETEGLIEFYKPKEVSKQYQPLMFRVYDGHFNPIPDEKRKSITSKSNNKGVIKSNDIENYEEQKKKEKEKKKYEIIAPTKEEYDAIKEELEKQNYPVSVRNQVALNYLKKNGMKVPYPLTDKNLVVDENSIVMMRYADKIVLTEPINERVKKWYIKENGIYNGEGYMSIMNRIWLDKYGFKLADAPFLSKPNVEVMKALTAGKVKWRTHLGKVYEGMNYNQETIVEMIRNDKAIAVDICKCYCDALYNPRERWIVFNGKEELKEYDGKPLTIGLYFVITDDMSLFHKSNWYSKQMIIKARQEGIRFRITHQIRCIDVVWEQEKYDAEGKSLWKLDNANLFENIIDEIVELTEQDEDFTLTKDLINAISGYLGKTHYKTKTAAINTKLKDIWENWIVADKDKVIENDDNIYISEIKDEETTMYLYGVEKQVENLSTGLPMYIQILDSANIALYDMMKAVGGKCLYRKTDMIVSLGGVIPEDKLIKYPCSYQETWGKYRNDKKDAVNYNYALDMNICRAVETPRLSQDWEHWDFNDSNDWERILDIAIKKGGMLISGRAGTGKSYIIKKGIEAKLLSADKETRMSFTNRAARNIAGTTIHKNLGINKRNKTNAGSIGAITKYKVFVIDEISMIYADLWNKLCLLKKQTGAIFILLGDYRQCPPIEDGTEIDYFNHPYAKYLANYNCCELTIPQRYDMPLWKWLEDFYEEGICDYDVIGKKKVTIDNILYRKNIVYYNDTRKTINELCMKEKIKTIKRYIVLEVPEKCSNDKAQLTYIYRNLPVMAITCNKDLEIINSDEFIVDDWDTTASTITLQGEYTGVIQIDIKEFHKLFVVNYAATTHKSQGATITEDMNIFDWDRLENDRRVGYTAVSRAKNPNQITIVENYTEWRFERETYVENEDDDFYPPDDDY